MELNSETFKQKCIIILQKNNNILASMFLFGFSMERRNDARHRFLLNSFDNPIKNKMKSQWNEDIWHKTGRGSAYVSPTEEEASNFPLEGILFVMLCFREWG
jgi:hypothetical protein